MEATLDLKKVTDEQVEKELKELQAKTDISPEEKTKLSELKEERQTRYEKKIKHLHSEKLAEKNRADKLEKDLEEQKSRLADIEKEKHDRSRPKIVDETIELGGKKFYTDESLQSMVASEELTPQQAYAHQRARDKEEIKADILKEQSSQGEKQRIAKEMQEDRDEIAKKYPYFSISHPDHDPEDPLYKTASELWVESYKNNPRGMTLAIKRAKQILRMSDERPDVSEEMSVGRNRSSSEGRNGGEREATLSTEEKDTAVRMYCNIVNPANKAGRNYTEEEAIIKATKAKTARMKR